MQGEVMNNVEAAPAAAGVAAPMIIPSEPVSIVVDEKLMVVLNKDGGVESMEVNGGMALQVILLATSTLPKKMVDKMLKYGICTSMLGYLQQ